MRTFIRQLVKFRAVVVIVLALLVSAIYLFFDSERNVVNAVGFGGFAAALGQLVLEVFRNLPALQVHRVLFVAKDNSPFTRAVLGGLREVFSHEAAHKLDEVLLHDIDASDPKQFARKLDEAYATGSYSAVIVRPTNVGLEFQKSITRILADGTFLILIDINVDREDLPRNLPAVPFFVGSDFSQGGTKLAMFVVQRATELRKMGRKPLILSLLGPTQIQTALKRGQSYLWELECDVKNHATAVVVLDSFDPKSAWNTVVTVLDRESGFARQIGSFNHLLVFCGNDNICIEFSKRLELLATRAAISADAIELVGYDGVYDEIIGDYVVAGHRGVIATVDALPKEQGRLAGQSVLEALNGRLAKHRPQRLVDPQVVELS